MADGKPASPFAPLAVRAFALLWTATLVSNIGTWMHDVSAAWLMTSLSPSPLVVALVQAATTAAMALFALPAGALADLFDRRRLLMGLVVFKAALAFVLGLLTISGLVDAWSLLLVTFLLGVGSALMAPVWQSIVPSLVPRTDLKAAVALNSLGINIARAIGPAVGGLLIVTAGVASAFFLNALSELVVLAALLIWRPAAAPPQRTSPEGFLSAMAAGLRYAAHAPALKIVLVRAAAFFLFASAFWALVPLVVRVSLGGDASLYGLVVGAVGVGAVAGALALPHADRRWGPDRLVQLGSLGTAGVLVVLALVPVHAVAIGAGFVAGIAWISVLSSLNVAAQAALPDWVRGRGLSIYGLVFFGAMTIGAIVWGLAAQAFGVSVALVAAAAGLAGGIPLLTSHKLGATAEDLTPAGHWPDPTLAVSVLPDDGPVLVTIAYRVAPEKAEAFMAAVRRLSDARRRDGAYQWQLVQDMADPTLFTEAFWVASWGEHERQHARLTKADAALQAMVSAFHTGPDAPVVRHAITRAG